MISPETINGRDTQVGDARRRGENASCHRTLRFIMSAYVRVAHVAHRETSPRRSRAAIYGELLCDFRKT